eukprot:762645-Hanusia_phi.AAC.1
MENESVQSLQDGMMFDLHDLDFERLDDDFLQSFHENDTLSIKDCPAEASDCGLPQWNELVLEEMFACGVCALDLALTASIDIG